MNIQQAIGDFIFQTGELSQRVRSDESLTVSIDDLDTLRMQLYLLDAEVTNLRNFLLLQKDRQIGGRQLERS